MGLFNTRSINSQLNDLIPVVEACSTRFCNYFQNNFKTTTKYKNEILGNSFGYGETEEIYETTQQHLDELFRLKNEFENEFDAAHKLLQEIKSGFLSDSDSYAHWNNKLYIIQSTYNMIIQIINHRKIYIKG